MPNWTASMQRTYEYYIVDPKTWRDKAHLRTVKSCTISRDLEAETLGSATFDVTESVGECYIRVYMITVQNGISEKHPMGTYLVQTPSSSFNGKIRNVSMDAYTPLLELKESKPPIGYFIPKNTNVMEMAYRITREHVRAPVVKPIGTTVNSYDEVADPNSTWLTFLSEFISNQLYENETVYGKTVPAILKYRYDLDEMGRILFAPEQDLKTLQPVWTYDDSNSSILLPEITMDHDIYGIPNVVEVRYSTGGENFHSRIVNDDPNSPVSTVNRGREILHRVENPSMVGKPTQKMIDEYAKQLLKELSSPKYTVTYTHGYCPVRIGDCVRLNYTRAGITDIKAKVVNQSIKCTPDCPVSEKAVFTTNLWR